MSSAVIFPVVGYTQETSLIARTKKFLGIKLSSSELAQIEVDRKEKEANRQNTIGQLAQNSADAFALIKPKKVSIKQQVIDFISSRGDHGATTEEILLAFPHIKFQSLAPRVTELHQQGTTVGNGVRQTTSGVNAVVFIINPKI